MRLLVGLDNYLFLEWVVGWGGNQVHMLTEALNLMACSQSQQEEHLSHDLEHSYKPHRGSSALPSFLYGEVVHALTNNCTSKQATAFGW